MRVWVGRHDQWHENAEEKGYDVLAMMMADGRLNFWMDDGRGFRLRGPEEMAGTLVVWDQREGVR